MKYLLFFAALIATANALECECSKDPCKENRCTVDVGNCYSEEREISTEKDKPLKATIKGCQDDRLEPNLCKQGFVFMSSEQDFYLGSNIACCKDNLCNQNLIINLNKTIPSGNLVCPSCFALDKKECDVKQMKCNNLQKKCFNITGTIAIQGTAKAKDFIARGCAIENDIFKKDTTWVFKDTTYKLVDVQLEDAQNGASQISSCLTFAILLPSVLWFLLERSL